MAVGLIGSGPSPPPTPCKCRQCLLVAPNERHLQDCWVTRPSDASEH